MSFMRFRAFRPGFLSCLLLAGLIFTAGIAYAGSGVMMCSRKIINAGDSKYLLISRFGQPDSKEFTGTVQRGNECIKVEEWVYICHDHAKPKMYVIRIIGTTIDSIYWQPDVQ